MSEQPDQNPPQGRSKTTIIGVSVAVALVLGSMGVRATMEQSKPTRRGPPARPATRSAPSSTAARWLVHPLGPRSRRRCSGPARDRWRSARCTQRSPSAPSRPALRSAREPLDHQPRADDPACQRPAARAAARVADRLGDKREGLLKRFQADYRRPVGVSLWVTLGVVLGFLLWIGGLVRAWYVGVNEQGRLTGLGWRWVGGSIGGFAVWALTLWLAP